LFHDRGNRATAATPLSRPKKNFRKRVDLRILKRQWQRIRGEQWASNN
jgi:hypothetical protein